MSSKKRPGSGRKSRGGRVTPKGTVPPEQHHGPRQQAGSDAGTDTHPDGHHDVVHRPQFQAPPAAVRRASRRGNR
jgi:hypothetical protein